MPVPPDVRAVAARRVDALGEQAQALLRAAAIFGRDFVLEEVRLAAGLDMADAVEAADAATAAGILHEVEGAPVRLAFEHELARRAVMESMSPARKALLHQRVAEAIEASGARAERAGELAMHYGSVMSLDVAPKAVEYALLAAARAGDQYAFAEQARHLTLAREALAKTGADDPLPEYEILMQLGLARYRAMGPDASQASFAAAAELAERIGDPRLLARAALGAGFERYLRHVGVVEHAVVELLERALSAMGEVDEPLAVSLRSALVLERCFLDPLERRRRDADDVVARASRAGDPHALLEAETARQVAIWHPIYTEELLARVPALDEAARRLGRLDIPIHLHCTAFGYALELNRRADLDRHFQAADSAAEQLGTPIHRIRVQALAICRTMMEGRLAAAQSAIDSSLPMMIEVHAEVAVQLNALWMFLLAREHGRLADLRPAFEGIVAAAPDLPAARALLAEICARSGSPDAARMHLDRLGQHDFDDIHDDFGWLAVLTAAATVAALTAQRERAAQLYALLAPYAGRNVITGVAATDRPVSFALGLLASALRDADAAVDHFTRAADEAHEFGALCWEGHSLAELGAVLRRSGHPRAAREPLRRALEIARDFGGEALARRAREELVASGARPRRERPPGAPQLTEGELRVARMAAQGRTNREIAEALFLAPRTVETHLTHAYRKLEITSRAELARALELDPAG
jgi:DNA-binding CsgD family transcriptional regulator